MNIEDRYFYMDVVKFWSPKKLSRTDIDFLRAHCGEFGSFRASKVARAWMTHKLGLRFVYYITQPDCEALRYLHRRFGRTVLINYLETAVEFITASEQDRRTLHQYLDRSLWQGNRSKRERIRRHLGTVYSGSRNARNREVFYSDLPSKVTGEVFCTKLEWRSRSAAAVRQKHVHTFADLIDFGHAAFWKKRLKLAEPTLDLEKLELAIENRRRERSGNIRLRQLPKRNRRYGHPFPRARLLVAACETEDGGPPPSFSEIKDSWDDEPYPLHKFIRRIPIADLLGV